MVEVKCGESECETEGVENAACLPIFIPPTDPDFRGQECLMFVRTQEAMRDNCVVGMLTTVHIWYLQGNMWCCTLQICFQIHACKCT